MLEKDLQEKIRRIRWKRNPALAKRELTFIGRNAEIDTFQSKLYSSRGRLLRAHITSGRPGIGKDCFAMKCLSELDKTKEFEPYRISMEAKDTIEFFILQLNQITRLYSDEEMRSGLAGPISGKVGLAVSMLNDIYSTERKRLPFPFTQNHPWTVHKRERCQFDAGVLFGSSIRIFPFC